MVLIQVRDCPEPRNINPKLREVLDYRYLGRLALSINLAELWLR